ncbi:SDR family NAD(P)-dependent oxidoreductase [Lewinella sp. IMCC34191]|uniref:SDR family NAD(P)-dependent oxidoreductase n=1 Tax=Lewinella sp. IMCC34191 TaxID=2259172 RepID=UPI000E27B70A|nr:SDR family oxidoreductase [Lewinella sp. IMCC34191]
MSAQNKTALVTGGSRGLGRDMALRLADKGLDVLLTYHSNAEQAAEVVGLIEGKGRKAAALQLNTSRVETFDAFFSEFSRQLQETTGSDKFDFLVNNAGTGLYAPVQQTTEEDFDRIVNIHFKGVYFLTQKALPLLNDGGGIVNVSSGLARFSYPGSSAYAAAKGATEVFTRYLARELGERKIRANIVAPGAIATDFGGGRVRDDEQLNQTISQQTALGRVGEAEDIGGVVAFLCTDDARWVNGQRIEVSGGIHL